MTPIHHRHHGEERFSEGRFHDGHHPHGHRFARHDRRHGDLQPDTAWSGRGGRRSSLGRFFAHGDLRLVVLHLIAEKPRHGYEIIKAIEESVGGAYSPSPGVIYPTLTFLEESEMILGDAEGGKKRYTITDAGRLSLSDQAIALDGVRMRIEVSKRSLRGHDRPAEIHEAVHNLRHALQMHHGRWSPEEILRVRDLLNNTAKAIVDGSAVQPAQEQAE